MTFSGCSISVLLRTKQILSKVSILYAYICFVRGSAPCEKIMQGSAAAAVLLRSCSPCPLLLSDHRGRHLCRLLSPCAALGAVSARGACAACPGVRRSCRENSGGGCVQLCAIMCNVVQYKKTALCCKCGGVCINFGVLFLLNVFWLRSKRVLSKVPVLYVLPLGAAIVTSMLQKIWEQGGTCAGSSHRVGAALRSSPSRSRGAARELCRLFSPWAAFKNCICTIDSFESCTAKIEMCVFWLFYVCKVAPNRYYVQVVYIFVCISLCVVFKICFAGCEKIMQGSAAAAVSRCLGLQ